ncbi:two-component system nitrogen regulation sensor histidine kinase NtrY [Seleniivibrio woodruffii]|uniref:histidine kinase n=2 Tax=Seleniivibrio woodruffii TaxID=1078050 RepID=A0A4R1K8U5_9BACT|nr:ATP-binding protein [Seleniivibrio woodruffii]TCK60788.1 two-component system nitrogen regulation sensor histidine kinase NtrY [Seleniivibrio woodruffii]TVZ36418.1 two-component system nitrogen regulation sensor histidine kinase NtrY [Seleniivibrio woodruffii]
MVFRFRPRFSRLSGINWKNKYIYMGILAILLIFNLIAGSELLDNDFPLYSNISIFLLANINLILLLAVFILIFRNLGKLFIDRKKNIFGARLQTKLVTFSIILAVIPAVIVFVFSNKIIGKNIDKWFNSQIQQALESSMNLMQVYQTQAESYVVEQGGLLASFISSGDFVYRNNHPKMEKFIKGYMEKDRVDGIYIYNRYGERILSLHKSRDRINNIVTNKVVNKILKKELIARYDMVNNRPVYWVGHPVYSGKNASRIVGAVVVYKRFPKNQAEDVANILKSYNTYRQTEHFIYPVKNSFKAVTTLMTLFVMFAAIWGSMVYAKSITRPIESLASASSAVSKGNLDVEVEVQGNDELAYLGRSFNSMIKRLNAHNTELNLKNEKLSEMFMQITRDNQYIDSIFKNVKSAIFLYTHSFELLKQNDYAETVLEYANEAFLSSVLTPAALFIDSDERESQFQIEILLKGELRTMTTTITKIFSHDGNVDNLVIVLDDITDLLNFQRVGIWKEIATRIAHEIKNPLTPIKLTAERIKRKAVMGTGDPETIVSSMDTIIAEVESLQSMVNEFNMFARLPELKMVQFGLKDLFEEILAFYKGSNQKADIEIDCPEVMFIGDKSQLKRVFINLVNNSIDAMNQKGKITVKVTEDDNNIRIDYGDNGEGIPQEDIGRVFIPYFSKKPDGTGLGLAIVKKIIEVHNGTITVESEYGQYTRFLMEFRKA